MTKSAQMPFSSWLLGAMVAPTPVSALLHSSTMVKAGVYIILRFAPVLQGNAGGIMVSLIGGVTFLVTSLIAISQSNAKKVLAYSTIANLGLIVACAGVGTSEAVWAGILLVIFHAIAKSLLFLSVGTVEHNVGSRDIEDMDGLIMRMPKVATAMVIGIAGMFLAPFGMLISKWAALKAFIDANFLLVGLIAFGSAATLFFWTKWMGKLISVINKQETIENKVSMDEKSVLGILATLVVAVCMFFPIVSKTMIEPFVKNIYGAVVGLGQSNLIIMSIMLGLILILPLSLMFYGKDTKIVPVYLAGTNVGDNMKFTGAMGQVKDLSMRNYYMENYFGENKMAMIGKIVTNLIFVLTVVIILMMFGVNII
jgi:ech hydrogenase subunit A